MDTLENLLAVVVTAASEQDRSHVGELARQVQEVKDQSVELAYVDLDSIRENAAAKAEAQLIQLEVVKHTEAKRGFVQPPRRWVVKRTSVWLARVQHRARDYERLSTTLTGWHWLAFRSVLISRLQFQSA